MDVERVTRNASFQVCIEEVSRIHIRYSLEVISSSAVDGASGMDGTRKDIYAAESQQFFVIKIKLKAINY